MKPRLFVSIIAVVALVIAGAAVIVLAANRPPHAESSSYYAGSTRTAVVPACSNTLRVYFSTDEQMRQAANEFMNESWAYDPIFETKAQNYERLKAALKDQPDALRVLRPENVPAVITLRLAYPEDRTSIAANLRSRYGPSNVEDPCQQLTGSTRKTAPTGPTGPTATPTR